jgi:Transposase IS66 family
MTGLRRPFYDLYEAHKSAVAKEALERIAALYAIEEEIRGRSVEERRAARNERSKPLLESLKKWFEETLGKLSKKSDTTRAIHYALDRWEAVTRYCDDGHPEIDNNAAERSLRAVTCCPASQNIRSTALRNCCLGRSQRKVRKTHLAPPRSIPGSLTTNT